MIALILLAGTISLYASSIGVIKNPKHNMEEKKYIPLVKTGELKADLEDDEFIFLPLSITGDGKTGIFVFDKLQSKIFKLDNRLNIQSSYGRVGQGPGDMAGSRMAVMLGMGMDGKLYANDLVLRKVMKFTKNLKYLQEYKYKKPIGRKPVVDSEGNIFFPNIEKNQFTCRNQEGAVLLNFRISDEDLCTLFYKKERIEDPGRERECAVTAHSLLLLYLSDSSTIFILRNGKIIKKVHLWPRDALADYKSKLKRVLDINRGAFVPMFFSLFTDSNDKNIFYLQYGKNKTKGINALYRFTTEGELKDVLFIKKQEMFVTFLLKQGNKFYARSGEKILIYEEGH
jgi:hypothetical protein